MKKTSNGRAAVLFCALMNIPKGWPFFSLAACQLRAGPLTTPSSYLRQNTEKTLRAFISPNSCAGTIWGRAHVVCPGHLNQGVKL